MAHSMCQVSLIVQYSNIESENSDFQLNFNPHTWAFAAFHLLKPERSNIAKSPTSCGISCNNIANVVIRPTWKNQAL